MATVDEIAQDIFRINVAPPDRSVTFSLFVVRADEPVLIETSYGWFFNETREAVARLIDPATIRHILVPHFEGDECGGMNHFLGQAPYAQVLGSPIAARGSLLDFALRPPRPVEDNELIDLGDKRLRILLTPQVHQWDSLLAFEETTGTLFSSDLFMHPGRGAAIIDEDRTEEMIAFYRESNLMPSMPHLHAALDKIEPLDVRQIACHHGSTITGGVIPRYFQAIRDNNVTGFAKKA
jgi:flavorubredoxin